MNCLQCYILQYVVANSYSIPAGLSPNTAYYLWVYKPNSLVKTIPIVTDASGNVIINSSNFPIGFFNQYGGEYQVEVSTDAQGQNLVNMFFSSISFKCVLLNFVCCE